MILIMVMHSLLQTNIPHFHNKNYKTRTLKMHYSQLHALLSFLKKPHGSALSQCAKKNVINCYLGNKISQQLSYKRYEKLHFLCTSLAVAYEMYTKEEMKLGFRVLSQSFVYRCLKGRFRVCKKNTIQRHSVCRLCKQ